MSQKIGDRFEMDGDQFEVEVVEVLSDRVRVKYPDGDEEIIRVNFEEGEYLVSKWETITEKDGGISIIELRYVGLRDGRMMVDIVATDEDGVEFRRSQLIASYQH